MSRSNLGYNKIISSTRYPLFPAVVGLVKVQRRFGGVHEDTQDWTYIVKKYINRIDYSMHVLIDQHSKPRINVLEADVYEGIFKGKEDRWWLSIDDCPAWGGEK